MSNIHPAPQFANLSLAWALSYAAQGLRVFPIEPGAKVPLTPSGHNDASADAADIAAWWAAVPQNVELNIGLALSDGYIAVDEDPRNGGDVSLAAMLADPARGLPDTRMQRTGGGGSHRFYRVPAGLQFPGELAKGVDVKQRGGYVVVAPSVHASGARYTWVDPNAPIADAPAWLVALARPRAKPVARKAPAVEFEGDDAAELDRSAVVSLLVPFFVSGRMHDMALAIGSYLCNRGYSKTTAEILVGELAVAAGSTDPDARARDAGDAWRYDHPAGWSRLKEMLPAAALAKLERLVPDLLDAKRREEAREIALQAMRSKRPPTIPPAAANDVVLAPETASREDMVKLAASLSGKKRSDDEQRRGKALKRAMNGGSLADDAPTAHAIAMGLAADIARTFPSHAVDWGLFASSFNRSEIDPADFQSRVLSEQETARAHSARERLVRERRRAAGLALDAEGQPRNCMSNVMAILESDGTWDGVLGYDLLAYRTAILKPPPFPVKAESNAWHDTYTTLLRRWIMQNYEFEASKEATDAAVDAVSQQRSFHPVRDYLLALAWDGTPRIDRFWSAYLDAPNDEWHTCIGAKFLIGCVARAMQVRGERNKFEAVKLDTCPVLEGAQGIKKSTAIRVLAGGDEFFSDTHLPIGNKDAIQQLDGIWIYEVADMSGISKASIESVKAFLSSKVDNIRRSYATRSQKEPRQSAFTATTNDEAYLTDTTGNRRFWPVKCGAIDVEGIRRDRDQLWAEAVSRFQAGERWWLEGDEHTLARVEQAERLQEDPWIETVAKWLARQPQGFEGFTIGDVLDELLGTADASGARKGRTEATRAGTVLRQLGYQARGKARPRRYYRDV